MIGRNPRAAGGFAFSRSRQRHYFFFCPFSIFAQVSRSDTVRLKTESLRGRIRIDAEIALPLELIAAARRRARQARLHLAALQHHQRIRVQVRLVILALRHVVRVRLREQVIVQPHLGVERVRGRHPVDRPLHLAAVRRVAAAGRRVVGAVQLDHLAGLRVLDHARRT